MAEYFYHKQSLLYYRTIAETLKYLRVGDVSAIKLNKYFICSPAATIKVKWYK